MGFKDWLFIPNGDDRRETATLLVGTAKEYGLDTRLIRPVGSGFHVSPEVEEALRSEGVDLPQPGADKDGFGGDAPEPADEPEDAYDPGDYTVAQVQEFVTDNPEIASDVLAAETEGKDRSTLVEWLNEFINDASSDPAGE